MTICFPDGLEAGSVVLSASDLTQLSLDCGLGYVLVSLDIGFPEERPVVRGRALADGVYDDSKFLGRRAITVTIRLNNQIASSQALIDRLLAFMSQRRRPTLTWALAGSPTEFRSVVVRGVNAPISVNNPKYPTIVCSFVTEDAYLSSSAETCVILDPNNPEPEVGRVYNLTFNRVYVPTPPVGGIYITNTGTAPANWTGTLRYNAINPLITVGSTIMDFSQNGGINLITGQTLVIDTKARTILLNGDPTLSRYDRVNFEDWSWDDLLLQPGSNLVRLQGSGFTFSTQLEFCWLDNWF